MQDGGSAVDDGEMKSDHQKHLSLDFGLSLPSPIHLQTPHTSLPLSQCVRGTALRLQYVHMVASSLAHYIYIYIYVYNNNNNNT